MFLIQTANYNHDHKPNTITKLFISGLMIAISISGFSQSSAAMEWQISISPNNIKWDFNAERIYTAHSVERFAFQPPRRKKEATFASWWLMVSAKFLFGSLPWRFLGRRSRVVCRRPHQNILSQTALKYVWNARFPEVDIGVKQEGGLGGSIAESKDPPGHEASECWTQPLFWTLFIGGDFFYVTGGYQFWNPRPPRETVSWSRLPQTINERNWQPSIFIDPAHPLILISYDH